MELNPEEELLNTLEESKDAEYVEHFSKKIIQNEKTLEIIFDTERTYDNDW